MEEYAPGRYKIIEKISEGVHGYVVKGIDLTTNSEVAIKKVAIRNKHGNISLSALREIKVLQNCNNKYIVRIIDIYPDLVGLSLVLEFMPNTLYGRLKNETNPLCRKEVKRFTHMMLKGLYYLHDLGIMHRDIKPANLLISTDGILKLADFGLARLYFSDEDRSYSPQVSTRWYRPPEILWGSQKYSISVDMWSTGCVFAEMLRGVPLLAGTTDIEQLALVIRTLGSPRLFEWPELRQLPDYNKIRFPHSNGLKWVNLFPSCTDNIAINLVSKLLVYNPKNRLTAGEALDHEYFT
ncbi:CDK20 family protein [Megaselia abdita]